MDVFEAIAKRSCYRGPFKDVPVPRDVLIRVIDAGIKAPSACNQQTPSFVAIDDPVVLNNVAKILATPVCKTAKAMIVCVSDDRPVYKGTTFHKEDCAAAVENMLLALTALGYSSVWIDGALRFDEKAERIAKVLKIPFNKRVQVVLPIGVPLELESKTSRLPFAQRASFNVWERQE